MVMAALLGLQSMSGSAVAQSPNISATKSDGTPAATKKAPGSTVTYTNVISNTGLGSATGVTFTDPDVAGAVVVPGTLKVSPIAFNDNYTGTIASGVAINTATSSNFSVTANDYVGIFNGAVGVLTITAFDATSAQGGTVSVTTSGPDMGKFTYTSAAGFTGVDSFTYTISNTGFTATGTVTVTVAAPGMVYVSATGDDTTGKGTAAAPFKTLAKAGTVDGSSDRVFLFSGTYTGGFSMENLEHLTGQGVVGASFDSVVLGFVPGSDSAARPTIGGTKPTINIGGGDPAIILAQDNFIRGVDIVGSAANFAIAGTSVNNFQFGNSTPGTAAADTTVTSTNAAGGCIALSGPASGTVNILGQVTATLGRSLDINSRTGGSINVIGKVTDNGLGINLLNNTGATFNFRCLTLANGSNTSFAANTSGTINLTSGNSDSIDNDGDGTTDEIDEANTINNTTGGVAVRLNGTNMGASSGINFRSITSTGGTEPGIIILGAGSSGFLSVTGDGGGTNNNSGGSITGKTGTTLTTGTPGVYVSSGPNLRLAYMNISSNNYAGIHGNLLNGILLTRCNISNNGDTYNTNEGGIELLNLSGTALAGTNPTRIEQCSVTNNKNFELLVSNTSAALPELQINTSTFSTNNLSVTEIHNHLVSIVGSGTAVMSAKVNTCTFTGTAVTGGGTSGTGVNADTSGGSLSLEVVASSFTNNNVAVTVSHSSSGNLTFDIHDNTTVHTNRAHGLNYFANVNTTGTANGKFRNNVVGLAGTAASASQLGNAITIQNESNNTSTDCNMLVTGNLLQENSSTLLNINQGVASQPGSRATNVTITNNTFRNSTAGRGIQLQQNNSTAPGITRASISTNTFSGIAGQAGDGTEMRLRHLAGGTFNVQQADHPTLASSNGLTTADILLAGTITFNSAAPPVPPLLLAPGGVDKVTNVTTAPLAVVAPAAAPSVESALPVAAVPAAPAIALAGQLTQAQLSATVAAAMDRWQASGLSAEQTALLRGLTFEVADLPDLRLGEADGRIIRVDSNAGGTGWYVNGSTGSDAEFSSASSATRLYTQPTGAPAGRLDLLTALMHEMGHALGLEDSYLAQDRESLMYGFLTMGERRLPAKGQAVGVTPHEHGGSHFLSAPINIGVLPPGKTVTISYDVTINDPVTVSPLSSQGTVSGGNFSNVLTDDLVTGGDPLLPGAADPTVTLISQPEVNVAIVSTPVLEDGGVSLTYTFTRQGSTTSAMVVNFGLSGTATPATDYAVNAGIGTLTYTSGQTTGSITIPVGSATASFNVTPVGDTAVEPNETVIVSVATGTGYDVGINGPATGTINNDDTGVSIDPLPDASLFEDQTLNFTYTFRRTGLTTGTTAADFNVAGSATFTTDYTQSGATSFTATTGTVVFNPGETTKVITLDPVNDNVVEGNETILLTVASGAGYVPVAPTSQTATIVDDDVTVTVAVSPTTSVEDIGTPMVYTFTRSGGSVSNALTVNVQVTGSADRSTDYSASGFASFNAGTGAATITFSGGSATKTVSVTPITDVIAEPDETVILTVDANGTPAVTGGYAVGAPSAATGTINDDDTQVSVAVSPSSSIESSGTGMVYTFTRTGSTAAALTANFTVTGTASFAAADYSGAVTGTSSYSGPAGTGTIVFPVGQSTATFTAAPLSDAIVEANETVIVTVGAGSGYVPAAGPNNVATGTITDDDTATVSIAKISDGSEGPPIVNGKFRLTQTAVSSTNTQVTYLVTGTASPGVGNDYTILTGIATILAGNTTVDIDVLVLADAVVGESTETVVLTLNTIGAGSDPEITIGAPNTATVNILSGPVPVASALGDTVTDNAAPGADGATNIGKFDLLRRSGYLAENGDLAFTGHLLVNAGPPAVTNNDFQGIWAKDAANPLRLIARSGSIAPGTSNALFDILPEVVAVSDVGDVTFFASLRVGTGSPAVTSSNDTGIWSTASVAGANPAPVLVAREGAALRSPSNAVITKFATGCFATSQTNPGVFVFSATEADGKTGVYVMTSINGIPSAAVTTAKEGNSAPGAGGEVYDNLASGFTDPARIDQVGNFCYSAKVKPSGKEGIWYAPIATGIASKVVIMGDAAPGTTTTFSRMLDMPAMGGTNNIAFHAYLAATGDNAANNRGDGIWKGVAPAAISAYTLVIRCGDTGVAGLPGGAKVGNLWTPWMSNANHLAFRGWVDVDGNGTSGNGTDVHGLYTDASGTMTMVIKQGDAAPGMPVGATMVNMDLPVIGGVEQMAFIGTVTGGGTTSANNQGIWRQSANGGALSLVVRTGDSVSTSQGAKVISKLDFPGTTQGGNTTDHRWEQWVMDSTGRIIIQATFADGTTAQLIAP